MIVRHYGKIGDVIYCLAPMKRIHAKSGQPIDVLLHEYRLSQVAMAALIPLINSQPYIHSVMPAAESPQEETDLDFRDWEMDYDHRHNTVADALEYAAFKTGLDLQLENPGEPWLHIEAEPNGLVLLNWTGRYLNQENYAERYEWRQALATHPETRFVGLASDHQAFEAAFEVHIDFLPTESLLELSRLISGCALFMGNQSSPLAIAHGLGKQVIAESSPEHPNCIFLGRGSIYHGVDEATQAAFGIVCN